MPTWAQLIRKSNVGKQTPEALYVHRSALSTLAPELRLAVEYAVAAAGPADVYKIAKSGTSVSALEYPDFDRDPHPALRAAAQVDLQTGAVRRRDYSRTKNPPILHRKELFVAEDHPLRATFAALTREEECCGLYTDPNRIGTRAGWQHVLDARGVRVSGHRVYRDGLPARCCRKPPR